MAIGTDNIGFSTIATEVGIAATDLKLSELTRQQVILNPTNSRQTYTLTNQSLTVAAEDSTVADNVNLASAPDEVSEFKSYTQTSPKFSEQGNNFADFEETINTRDDFAGGCFVTVELGARLWCQRVSNDLVWYVDQGSGGSPGTSTYRKEGTILSQSGASLSPTEVCRLAGVGSDVTIATSVTTLDSTQGQIGGSISTNTTGLSGTGGNLTSTNSKYGINYSYSGLAECVPPGNFNGQPQKMNLVYLHKTDVTVSGKRVRQLQFHVGLKCTYQTNQVLCC